MENQKRGWHHEQTETTSGSKEKEAPSSVQKVQSTAGEAQSAGQASKQE